MRRKLVSWLPVLGFAVPVLILREPYGVASGMVGMGALGLVAFVARSRAMEQVALGVLMLLGCSGLGILHLMGWTVGKAPLTWVAVVGVMLGLGWLTRRFVARTSS